jgi:hypothetical protein
MTINGLSFPAAMSSRRVMSSLFRTAMARVKTIQAIAAPTARLQ